MNERLKALLCCLNLIGSALAILAILLLIAFKGVCFLAEPNRIVLGIEMLWCVFAAALGIERFIRLLRRSR